MSFIVEDGTGVDGANALIDVAYFVDYHAERGNADAADADEDAIQTWIIRATDYVNLTYVERWLGDPINTQQALVFPRTYRGLRTLASSFHVSFVLTEDDDGETPDPVRRAVAILADKVRQGVELFPVQTRALLKRTVGPLQWEYDRTAPNTPRFPEVEALLDPYFLPSTGRASMMRVERR